jgi:hypothetical protein
MTPSPNGRPPLTPRRTADANDSDLSPLCPCGGVCVHKTKQPSFLDPTGPVVELAVCLRRGKVRGNWTNVMRLCREERATAGVVGEE